MKNFLYLLKRLFHAVFVDWFVELADELVTEQHVLDEFGVCKYCGYKNKYSRF